jgi:transmembrane sensor
MERSRFAILFHRYVNNNCSKEEEQEFLQLVASPENDDELKALMDQLWGTVPEIKLQDLRAANISNTILESDRLRGSIHKPSAYYMVQRVAAVLFLGVAVGVILYFYPNDFISRTQLSEKSVVVVKEPGFIRLPDGSTVILNAESRLEYSKSFENKSVREVYLTGEGFFDVKQDPSKPFLVHTGKLKTTVLGTAFNVKAFADETSITVTVTRGKVKVSDDVKILGIISHNQQITFDKNSDKALQKSVNSQKSIAWVEKDIFFDNITLVDAVEQLEKRFGITIRFGNDASKQCRFTATFVKGENLDQILNIICEFNKATFEYDSAGAIEINGEGC